MSGFRVLNAANKADAELICKRYLGRIHLIVIDLDLAETDGVKLALELQALRPEMRLLGLSAHPQRTRIESWLRGGAAILKKPVPAKQLAQRAREVMNGRQGEPS
jgi:two-component system response regulator RegA